MLRAWGSPDGIVCLSVRSGFELLLDALELEAGDEIAFSAITHPDMVRIAEARGLRVLPVDLDLKSLEPDSQALERALGPSTRLIVVAHLFGGLARLGQVAEIARRQEIVVVEDCAQSVRRPGRPRRRERGRVALQLRLDQDGHCPRRCTCPCRRCRPDSAHATAPGSVARTTSPRVRRAGGKVRFLAGAQPAARLRTLRPFARSNRPRPRCLRQQLGEGVLGIRAGPEDPPSAVGPSARAARSAAAPVRPRAARDSCPCG